LHVALPGFGQGREQPPTEKLTTEVEPASLLALIELEPTMRPQKWIVCCNRLVGEVIGSTTGASPRQDVRVAVAVTVGVAVGVSVMGCAITEPQQPAASKRAAANRVSDAEVFFDGSTNSGPGIPRSSRFRTVGTMPPIVPDAKLRC
jgi:hypothetical protein